MTGVLFPARERYYFLLYSVKTGSGAHLASCPAMDIYVGVRRQWFEADHSPLSSAEVKSVGAVPSLPPYVFDKYILCPQSSETESAKLT
jgi:hypothetical protein